MWLTALVLMIVTASTAGYLWTSYVPWIRQSMWFLLSGIIYGTVSQAAWFFLLRRVSDTKTVFIFDTLFTVIYAVLALAIPVIAFKLSLSWLELVAVGLILAGIFILRIGV
jgi:drug/metabolite transporter (DMT)-like permease